MQNANESIAARCYWPAYPDSDEDLNEASPLLSVDSLPAYSYGTIAMDEFRIIVRHLARNFSDNIELHLQIRKRSASRFCEAMLHAWGTDRSINTLLVHDQKFADAPLHDQNPFTRIFRYYESNDPANAVLETKPNVATMLRHLHCLWLSRYPWIDAISTDQKKRQQLNQMGEIYRKSGRTVIWLGSSKVCPRPLSALRAAARTQRAERWEHLGRKTMGENYSKDDAGQKDNMEEDMELQDLLSLPSFDRRWAFLSMCSLLKINAYVSR
jgi:hypothetical protein